MILSHQDILAALKKGDLKIQPFDECMLRPAGLTLHLGEHLLIPGKGTIDVVKGEVPSYKKVRITKTKPYSLKAGEFILGETYQDVYVGPKYGMMVESRSTIARFGITVTQSASMIDTGHNDRIVTLEIKNNGKNAILLYPRMAFVRAYFFKLSRPAKLLFGSNHKYGQQYMTGEPLLYEEELFNPPEQT